MGSSEVGRRGAILKREDFYVFFYNGMLGYYDYVLRGT